MNLTQGIGVIVTMSVLSLTAACELFNNENSSEADQGSGAIDPDATKCESGLELCSGKCVDLREHGEHCGACDHSCQDSVCEEGACLPVEIPIEINKNNQEGGIIHDVEVDANHIYWTTDQGFVRRKPLFGDDQSTKTIAENEGSAFELVITDSHVFWVSTDAMGEGFVKRKAKGDHEGLPETLAQMQKQPRFLTLVGPYLYWANKGDGSIQRLLLKTGQPILDTIATAYMPASLHVNPDYIYYSEVGNLAPVRGIYRMSQTGGEPQVVAADQPQSGGLLADGTHLYWGDSSSGLINRVSFESLTLEAVAMLQQSPVALALDDVHLYWTAFGAKQIMRSPKTLEEGAVSVYNVENSQWAGSKAGPSPMTADKTYLYWADVREDGTSSHLRRMVK